jgi:Methyltransferase domain
MGRATKRSWRMKTLLTQIESELNHPDHQDGWCSVEKANALASTIVAIRPNLIVEIGIWSGKSLIPMALTLKKLGKGKLIGIDPWDNKASAEDLPSGEDKDWWAKVDHNRVFNVFNKWVADTKIEPFIEIHRCRSDEFKVDKIGLIDLLHIDGSHGEQASTYDVKNFASKVRRGGFLFMDDIGWAAKATEMIPQVGFRELYQMDTGKMFQRIDYGIKI